MGLRIIETNEITFELTNPNGDIYEVKVTFGKNANIPEGSRLEVTPFEEGSEDYEKALKVYLASQGEDADASGFAALDISIIDPNGNEIEPDEAVTVDMRIKSLPGVDNLEEIMDTMAIHHHIEKEDGSIEVEKVQFQDELKEDGLSTSFDIATANRDDSVLVNQNDINSIDISNSHIIDVEFEATAFSTYTVTWYQGGWGGGNRSATVHYGYMDGNTFVEFPNGTPSYTPAFNDDYAFLIYDVDGYEYDSTHLGSATGTSIKPLLDVSGNNHRYTTGSTDWWGNLEWSDFSNGSNIYVVYKSTPTPSEGGTPPAPQDETWPEGKDTPQFGKSSKNNGNGTNTVSLSIKAAEKPVEKKTPADVIVVFDVSGSMDDNLSGNTKRLAAAKTAVNTMANTLLNGQNSDVRMALISFSTDATEVQGFTDNYTTFSGKVNGLTASGGTNWEKALKLANEMKVRSDAATFVVFVTDGDPTFRVSRGQLRDRDLDLQDGYTGFYLASNVFGEGNDDSEGYNFDFAVNQVSAIDSANKNFYAIGISNDVKKVQDLTTEGGVDANHAFIASDTTAMNNAFKSITEAIKSSLGFGDVEITDGITDLTSTRMEMLHSVDANSFKYYRYGGEGNKYGPDYEHKTEWTSREADGCGPATYDEATGAVEWNMGDNFQLEDGVTYVVEFIAWPSQEAYDLVADLNNGIKSYTSLTDNEKSQVVEVTKPEYDDDGNITKNGTYALKTNTDEVNATYKKTTKTGESVTISDNTPISADYTEGTIQNMALESMKLTIKKEFEDSLANVDPITGLPEDRDTEVTLVLKRRNAHQDPEEEFSDYAVPQGGTTSANIVLNEGNDWTYELYVAPGFELEGETLEHGYDFTVTEPGIDYHYGLVEEIINPMVVDGEDKYYGDGYLIDDDETIEKYTDRALTAVNRVKSGIDIRKLVYDVGGTTEIHPDTKFTITGYILDKDGNPYTWAEGDDVNATGAYHKFTPVLDANGNYTYNEDGTIKYDRTVYKGHFASTGAITLELTGGEWVRFINVPEGCTFQFTEPTNELEGQGYKWKSTDAVTQHKEASGGDWTSEGDIQPEKSGQTAKLETGVVGNKQYSITYGNERTIALPDVDLVKVDATSPDTKLNDAEFALYSDAELTKPVTVDGNGNTITIKTGNKQGSTGPDGWSHIGLLPAGTYYMVEITEPTGYVLDETPVIITVTKEANSYTVTATKKNESVISGSTDDGLYTITISNQKAVKPIKVFKYETGTSPEKPLSGAIFSLTGPDGSGISYTGLKTNADGYVVFDEDNSIILELPVNTEFTLTETKSPDGYNIMAAKIVFSVTTTGVTGQGTGYETIPETETKDGEEVPTGVYIIKVANSAGVELPETGGPGTLLYTLSGLLLIVGSAIGLRMRREKGGVY